MLDLSGNPYIDDAALKEVAKLESLRSLRLANCGGVTDDGVRYLGELAQLEHLDLSSTRTTQATAFTFKNLKVLDVSRCPLSLHALGSIRAKGLRILYIRGILPQRDAISDLRQKLPECMIVGEEDATKITGEENGTGSFPVGPGVSDGLKASGR
jgi:hypothetical protein